MGDIRSFFGADTNSFPESKSENNSVSVPGAKGKKWLPEEESQLLVELENGHSISDIASIHDRTYGGITSRMREIACKMLGENISIQDVMKKTTLTEAQINDAMEKKRYSSLKKNERILEKQMNKECDSNNVMSLLSKKTEKVKPKSKSTIDQLKSSVLRKTLEHKLSIEQQCAIQQFEDGDNLFITGQGGTGKTLLIKHLVKSAHDEHRKVQVCALTGCAALLLECNARTIHSWSGIKLGKGERDDIVTNILYNHPARNAWRNTDILIVDEISMMSKRIFDLLNYVGQRVRSSTRPFGGIQVVFVGDFFQLPPVATQRDSEDDNSFCFESESWNTVFSIDNHIVLNTIFRQEDKVFRRILGNVRMGIINEDDVDTLKTYVNRDFDKEKYQGVIPTKLFPTKNKVDFVNKEMFEKLEGDSYTFQFISKTDCDEYLDGSDKKIPSQIISKCKKALTPQRSIFEIESLSNNSPCVKILELKKGANVMCTVNLDLENGICNGSIGTVVGFATLENNKIAPIVRFSNGRTVTLTEKFWQSEDYPTIAVGQFPLCLAWAITIHKIQGATLTMAEIDIGSGIFECGQTYVALSRVKNLEGLYLSKFDPKKVKTNKKVKQFYDSIPVVEYEEEIIEEEEHEEKKESSELSFDEFVCPQVDT